MSCIFMSHSQWFSSFPWCRLVAWQLVPAAWQVPLPCPCKISELPLSKQLARFHVSPVYIWPSEPECRRRAEAQISHLRRLKWVEACANTHACMGEG